MIKDSIKYLNYKLIVILLLIVSCENKINNTEKMITKIEVLEIAELDANQVYKDLTLYKVIIQKQGDNWHVDYELIDLNARGGGPHYIISSKTGEIIEKRYEQ